MCKVGILAYGSLIEKPGDELNLKIVYRVENVITPFAIEFARKSQKRNYAPTVIPVKSGGANVKAQILVLSADVTIEEANNLLWRRETGREGQNCKYTRPDNPGENHVLVEFVSGFYDVETVLYTNIGSNIEEITASNLASLAIASAKSSSGKSMDDGISYLISLNRQGIKTALSAEYEEAILEQTNTSNLEEAWEKVQRD